MGIGKRICEIRKKCGMTQDELANKLFVSDKTVSSWESERTEPSLDIVTNISEVLEVPISYLIYGTDSKMDIETEIKIRLSEIEYNCLKEKLDKIAEFKSDSRQVDTYYQPTNNPFLKEGNEDVLDWLRIGIRGNKKILNYKHWYQNKYCDEYEVTIDDEDNLGKIFKILDLEVIAVVDKSRLRYMYQDKYEISLDSVLELGYFVEIEVKNYDLGPKEEYDKLLEVVKAFNLNVKNIDKRGYPYHLIYKSKKSI